MDFEANISKDLKGESSVGFTLSVSSKNPMLLGLKESIAPD